MDCRLRSTRTCRGTTKENREYTKYPIELVSRYRTSFLLPWKTPMLQYVRSVDTVFQVQRPGETSKPKRLGRARSRRSLKRMKGKFERSKHGKEPHRCVHWWLIAKLEEVGWAVRHTRGVSTRAGGDHELLWISGCPGSRSEGWRGQKSTNSNVYLVYNLCFSQSFPWTEFRKPLYPCHNLACSMHARIRLVVG